MSIMHELNRLQEVHDVICEHTKDAVLLPQSGEQVLLDLKATDSDTTWKYQVCWCLYYLCQGRIVLPSFVSVFVSEFL